MKKTDEEVRVHCPINGKERTVYLYCADDFPIHCNQCNEASGDPVCKDCGAGAILYYIQRKARNEIIHPLDYIHDKSL